MDRTRIPTGRRRIALGRASGHQASSATAGRCIADATSVGPGTPRAARVGSGARNASGGIGRVAGEQITDLGEHDEILGNLLHRDDTS